MGKVLRFPGAGSQAPGKVPVQDTGDYPHRVYPMPVRRTKQDTWDPMPSSDWSAMEFLRWHLGVIATRMRVTVPVEVRTAARAGGLYAIRVGDRNLITGLPYERALAILLGVYEAVSFLEESL